MKNVNEVLGPAVIGMDPADQRAVDTKMIEIDGTKNKSNMGANGEFSRQMYEVEKKGIQISFIAFAITHMYLNIWWICSIQFPPTTDCDTLILYRIITTNNLLTQNQPSSESH